VTTTPAPETQPPPQHPRGSPFPGLVPYSLSDADYFFGRDRWSDAIIDNLFAYRLSILYGASGIGKSSVLDAGVVHRLVENARGNESKGEAPGLLVAVCRRWTDDPVGQLKNALINAAELVSPRLAAEPPDGSLAEVLDAWSERVSGPALVILDQFEEYFLYNREADAASGLDMELVEAMERRNLPANFLFSIREDALAKLDRFEPLLSGLLSNLIRIEHMDMDDARAVIEKGLDRWSRDHGERFEVEEPLIRRVLEDVQTDRLFVGEMGHGVTPSEAESENGSIEAPYLQLVMTRLWKEEHRHSSSSLRLATLESLGGVKSIVETHVDQTMSLLAAHDRDVAARVFHYLVTPSGAKIAHSAADLAKYADADEWELTLVLSRLAAPDLRVLRLVPPPNREGEGRFEIFHDVLARAVLDWQARYDHDRTVRYGAAAAFSLLAQAYLVFVPSIFLAVSIQAIGASDAGTAILSGVWTAFGFLWWSLTTVLFFHRRRGRARSIWVIPLYDAIAICLGPIALIPLALHRWRRRRRTAKSRSQ
jgi:hypothetical protein